MWPHHQILTRLHTRCATGHDIVRSSSRPGSIQSMSFQITSAKCTNEIRTFISTEQLQNQNRRGNSEL